MVKNDSVKKLVSFFLCLSIALCMGGPIQSHHTAVAKLKTAAPGGGGGMVAQDNFDAYDDGDHYVQLASTANWVNEGSDQIWVFNDSGDGYIYSAISGAATSGCRNLATVNANHYSQVVFEATGASLAVGPACRMQAGADSFYAAIADSATLYLVRKVGGTETTLTSTAKSYTASNKLRIEPTGTGSGTRLTVYEDTGSGWAAVSGMTSYDPGGTYLDSGFTGVAGFGAAPTTRADLWECGNL